MTHASGNVRAFSVAAAKQGRTGKIYLVGAGPGNVELLTLKAARILREADVVLIDGGLPPSTPVAAIQYGTLPQQRHVVTTLTELPERSKPAGSAVPPSLQWATWCAWPVSQNPARHRRRWTWGSGEDVSLTLKENQ